MTMTRTAPMTGPRLLPYPLETRDFHAGDSPRSRAVNVGAEPLSTRESEVLGLVAEGNSNKMISARLVISDRTVKNHLTNIMTKLRASDRTHAVVTAIRLGWLTI